MPRTRIEELMNEGHNPVRDRGRVVLSLLIHSFWVLGVGIAVAVRGNSTVCIAGLRWPTLFIGIFFLVISIIGCCAVDFKYCIPKIFLVGLFFALLALSIVIVFSYVAVNGKYWGPISACLRHRNTCGGGMNWTSSDNSLTISPVQSGCCKPPSSCAFTFVNGTTWSPPTSGAAGATAAVVSNDDDDCSRWSNDQGTLCFQCDSCKASVLGHIKGVWHSGLTMWMTAMTIVLVLGYYPIVTTFAENEYDDDDRPRTQRQNIPLTERDL